jgi:hypothetical protein
MATAHVAELSEHVGRGLPATIGVGDTVAGDWFATAGCLVPPPHATRIIHSTLRIRER